MHKNMLSFLLYTSIFTFFLQGSLTSAFLSDYSSCVFVDSATNTTLDLTDLLIIENGTIGSVGGCHGYEYLYSPCANSVYCETTDSYMMSMKEDSEGSLDGILEYTGDEVVSSDFIHCPASSIFDAGSGMGLSDTFFKLVSWYDNEWGYSNRCVDLLKKVSNFV